MSKAKESWLGLALVLLGFTSGAARLAAQIEVSVELMAPPSSGGTEPITIITEPAEPSLGRPAGEVRELRAAPGLSTLDLPSGRSWRLRAQAKGYWGPTVEVRSPAAVPVSLPLFPTGILRGTLALRGAPTSLEELTVSFAGDVHGQAGAEIPAGTVACPVADGSFRCEVPAGTLNLTLAGGQLVPLQFWEIRVERGEVQDLGAVELELGGTLWGWVELEGRASPGEECEVRLLPQGSSQQASRSRQMQTAAVAPDGSFEFVGVPVGEFVPTASRPDYLPATGSPLEILAGETVEMREPLVLRLPATLELFFTPPTGPGGRGWRFTVSRLDPASDKAVEVLRGEAGDDGTWVEEELTPGLYELKLSERLGRKGLSQEIEVPGGRTSLQIDLPVVAVEGQVLLGGEPLSARVNFSRPDEKLSASFESDESGFFQGLLPEEGRWEIRVDAPEEGLRRSAEPIEVWAQGSSGVALVDIVLPGTVLEGEVTDLFGNAVAQASVRVQRRGYERGSASYRTDEEGRFRIRGLEPGSISVMAQSGQLRSEWFHLVLYDGQPVTSLQLVLK